MKLSGNEYEGRTPYDVEILSESQYEETVVRGNVSVVDHVAEKW